MIRTLGHVDEKVMAEIIEEMKIRRTKEVFLLFSLGSQFDHLIAMMLNKIGVFCLVADPARVKLEDLRRVNPKGIVLSGGPVSVYKNPPPFDCRIFDEGIPVLGICLGFQLWANHIGCIVEHSKKREFGIHEPTFACSTSDKLLSGCYNSAEVLESHGDRILPLNDPEFCVLCSTDHAPVSAAKYKNLYGVQFHPEVSETNIGQQIFENFCFTICGSNEAFPAKDVAQEKIVQFRKKIGDKKVVLALSGGSDSSVVAYLLKRAMVGRYEHLQAIYIKGIDRPEDEAHVLKYFGNQPWLDLRIIDATEMFLAALEGITDPREKRIAMRKVYKRVLETAITEFSADFIAQGTLYTDISESGGGYDSSAAKAQIKLHHNVDLGFSVPELLPLADQVKDTGRDIGRSIGVPEELLFRHPFPGPGLLVRISGEITDERLRIARHLDAIFIEELRAAGLYEKVWQAGAYLTTEKITCTKGDDAVSGWVVILWAVNSVNGFTATAARLPEDFWERVDRRMCNEIREVGCTCRRNTGKPPATIEFQ